MAILEQSEALSIEGQPRVGISSDRSTSSSAQIKALPFEQGDDSYQAQLPEDILHQIHFLMPMREAAQATIVSHSFLCSWRFFPKLILSIDSLGINKDAYEQDELATVFISRAERIMQSHSGRGVKVFKLETFPCSNMHPSYVDHWLQVALTPGIEEIKLSMFKSDLDKMYNFPVSFLSNEARISIKSFLLAVCSFHSAAKVGCMSSLTNLDLYSVHITGEELYGFLSNSLALERFKLCYCDDIVRLRIPSLLQALHTLNILGCGKLKKIDSTAPNLCNFSYSGPPVHISLGDALQVRKISFSSDYSSNTLYYASTKLPFIAPHLETLELSTSDEMVDTPMACGKFLQLKYLEIVVSAPDFSQDYDLYSLVSFLDASPLLETFILRIALPTVRNDSIIADSGGYPHHRSLQRCLSECYHDNLKNVMITGFCSAKSLIDFTIHVIEKTKLQCLTLDTTRGHDRSLFGVGRCLLLNKEALMEADKARVAIRRYVEGIVPSYVDLKIIEPCSNCMYKP